MAYIIENINLLKKDKLEKMSILVKDERVHSINSRVKQYSYQKMNAGGYITTTPHILLDSKLPSIQTFPEMKSYFTENFIKMGCTAFLTYVPVYQERQLKASLKQLNTKLLSSPIDYITAVKIPLSLLTPSFLRAAKKEKIPAVFIDLTSMETLKEKPWGWIREAMFPYNSPLVPIFSIENDRERKHAKQLWNGIMVENKIPFIKDELLERVPISKGDLQKIGILPLKSHLHPGSEVSYNFYLKSQETNIIDEMRLFLYHNDKLLVTVHKGAVIRAGDRTWFRPGVGEHVIIKTPNFFSGE